MTREEFNNYINSEEFPCRICKTLCIKDKCDCNEFQITDEAWMKYSPSDKVHKCAQCNNNIINNTYYGSKASGRLCSLKCVDIWDRLNKRLEQ